MNSRLQTAALVAEIVGSVSIVVTLIYLAIQTSQNTDATLAASRNQLIQSDVAILQMALDHPAIFETMWKPEGTDLSTAEAVDLQSWLIALVRTREHQFFQYRSGALDQGSWESFLTGVTGNLSRPLTRIWWDNVAYEFFDEEFVDVVSERLRNTPIQESFPNVFRRQTAGRPISNE